MFYDQQNIPKSLNPNLTIPPELINKTYNNFTINKAVSNCQIDNNENNNDNQSSISANQLDEFIKT